MTTASGPITREQIYAFERQATARDRMPMAQPGVTNGRVYSSFVDPRTRAATWWWTNSQGDLWLFRANALTVLQHLQQLAGARVDHYWGSETRTALLQYTGLSDRPGAVVSMRELLERALAKAVENDYGHAGIVVIPQLAVFPPTNAPTGTRVDGVMTQGDSIRYWDGSLGVFTPTAAATTTPVEARPTATQEGTIVATAPTPPAPAPAAPRRGRIAIVVRPILPAGSPPISWNDAHAGDPLTLVEQVRLPDRMRVVADGPGGFSTPFGFSFDYSGRPYSASMPTTFLADIQQNIEATWDPTNGLQLVSNVSVPLNSPSSDGTVAPPMQLQQAGILGNISPLKAALGVGVVMGVAYLIDQRRAPKDRWFRRL